MITKQLIKVSKELLLELGMYQAKIDTASLTPEVKDFSKCRENCLFYKYRNTEEGKKYCDNHCIYVLSHSSYNLGMKDLTKKKTITHSQINQLLLYHSLAFDANGETIEMTHKEVAKSLNCSERTARDNMYALEKLGYIFINYKKDNTYKAFIRDYYKYHDKGGRGYLYLNNRCFKSLIKINNINTLRFALNALVKLDDMRITKAKVVKKELFFRNIFRLLPSSINCIKQLKEIIMKAKDVFNIKFSIDSVTISFKTYTDSINSRDELEKTNKKAINKLLKKMNLQLNDPKEKEDILQMSIQYNIHLISMALKSLEDFKPTELGSYVRTIIRKNIKNWTYSFSNS